MTNQRFRVIHRPDEQRYVLIDGGEDGAGDTVIGMEGYVDVVAEGRTQRVMHHTEVSPDYGGQGLASRLVREAIDDTVAGGGVIVPVCSYVQGWVEKHPDYAEHVVAARPEHLDAVPRS